MSEYEVGLEIAKRRIRRRRRGKRRLQVKVRLYESEFELSLAFRSVLHSDPTIH